MSPARLAFIQGFCAALATARPLQNQIAEKLKNQQPIGSIPPHSTATTRISADGWVLLTTPRYQRQIILIPRRNGSIAWEQHFERGELRR